MASIQQLRKSVRAVVRRKNFYASRSFKTREEAVAWAAAQEEELYRRNNADVPNLFTLDSPRAVGILPPVPSAEDIISIANHCPKSAVYFLLQGNEIVYVGESHNVLGRLAEHWKNVNYGRTFDRYAVLPCDASTRKLLEKHYIRKLKPKYNAKDVDGPEIPDPTV